MTFDELKEKCELLRLSRFPEKLTNEEIGEMFLVLIHEIKRNTSRIEQLGRTTDAIDHRTDSLIRY